MKKQKIFTHVVVWSLAVLLLGCSKSTGDEVITLGTILEKIDETEVHNGTFRFDATNDYKYLDGSSLYDMRMYAESEYSWSHDFANIYMKTYNKVIRFSNPVVNLIDQEMELYIMNYPDEAVAFIKQDNGLWIRGEAKEIEEMEEIESFYMDDFILDASALTDEQLQTIAEYESEREYYKIEIQATYSQAGAMLRKIMDNALANVEGIAMDVQWDFTFHVKKDTFEPIFCEIRLNETVDLTQKDKKVWSELCEIDITYDTLY